ncbi:TetR family transcriptional regulator C-terminal domain-containing protein [Paracoccus sulfuroxidans]|uniref:TetR family transcriptional regulator n=1 Tax=Paracoccus sulfuroxidans TaxID=384678 RepID=A0A562NXH8_9RHOB|nr:TetR family transcriptional regulator C-terminal domain-containing protein [Paracoccus sulfuroxidans]TWI36937.1 TetR family transcriptional regulator [Paracoccus sulfuroxidans]
MSVAQKKRMMMHDAIREGAIREFARNGLAGTSTQAIAEAAGITKAQLHYYISSKEELYQQVLGDIVRQFREIFFITTSQDDPRQAITSYIARKIRHTLEHPEITRLFAHEIARGGPEMSTHWQTLKVSVEEANQVIRGWIEAGKIRPVDPLLLQMNLWAVTQHYAEYEAQARMLMELPDDVPLDAERLIHEATQTFLLRCGLTDDEETTP